MPVVIGLSFLAGRYHATTWGRHVNEGSVEWPPSPWRLLRSIVASWKTRTEFSDATLASVLGKLAMPPEFELPAATVGHTRHYMPLYHGDRTLVFDAFAALDRASEVKVSWPGAELSTEEQEQLGVTLQRMNYFGRAESWCSARLLEETCIAPNCTPLTEASVRSNAEPIRILGVHAETAVLPGKPATLWPLCAGTAELRKAKWSSPPGSMWHTYLRRLDCFAGGKIAVRKRVQRTFTTARFGFDSPVLPHVTETLSIGEFARRALQWHYDKHKTGAKSVIFSGKNLDGTRVDDHRHAFFLPEDSDGDGRIDHLTVYAKGGFDPGELDAFDSFDFLRQVGSSHTLKVVLADLSEEPYESSQIWRSTTPYVPVRHTKMRGGIEVDGPGDQLLRELEKRGFGRAVIRGQFSQDARKKHWRHYRRERLSGGGSHGQFAGYGFEIAFEKPITGPIALGYACHFGLGQFTPVD